MNELSKFSDADQDAIHKALQAFYKCVKLRIDDKAIIIDKPDDWAATEKTVKVGLDYVQGNHPEYVWPDDTQGDG